MAHDISDDGVDFSRKWAYSDICFVTEEKQIHASKMILIMWSPVFEAMFRSNFKEKNAKEITLPNKKHEDLIEFMKVLHPPNKEIDDDNVMALLPLMQEYQIKPLLTKCEDHLVSQANTVKNFLIAQKYGLEKLLEANLSYLKRAPITRLQKCPEFEQLDKDILVEILMEKCQKFESHLESLREVRMVLERKKPTTFPGVSLLCAECTSARDQQVDCGKCMKSCCSQITEILRNVER